ncbi:MAG: hypothetical protein H0X29_09495 [Parachlamydiaceae bacterium]|nr:hypothetical protein [Parachlamydiaceae bacterium]
MTFLGADQFLEEDNELRIFQAEETLKLYYFVGHCNFFDSHGYYYRLQSFLLRCQLALFLLVCLL